MMYLGATNQKQPQCVCRAFQCHRISNGLRLPAVRSSPEDNSLFLCTVKKMALYPSHHLLYRDSTECSSALDVANGSSVLQAFHKTPDSIRNSRLFLHSGQINVSAKITQTCDPVETAKWFLVCNL